MQLDGKSLSIENVLSVAREGENVELAPNAKESMNRSHKWLQEILSSGEPVYGINTGFGIFADQSISPENSIKLSRNLILSHAVATGESLSEEIVRAAMLIRANTLASGYSGVRTEVVEILLAMLNKGVSPVVPAQGSLGSSGRFGVALSPSTRIYD